MIISPYTLLFPLALASLSPTAVSQSFSLDFQNGVASWQTVLDGVMGGRSSGRVAQNEPGVMSFSGDLSLANNGGFSQCRTAVDRGALTGAKEIVLECLGDGRTYKFDIRLSNVRMMAGAYQRDFTTKDGEWITVRMPLDEFSLYSFGRKVRNAPELDPSKIEALGITLADKVEGSFRIDIRRIATADATDAVAATTPAQQDPRQQRASKSDLGTVATQAGLTTLLKLVTAAGIKLPDSPVTIFAPTNEAFAAIPPATLNKLLRPESRETLQQILAYHVVPGAVGSSEVLNARSLTTLIEQPLEVDSNLGQIAGARIVAVDVPFDGGIVHVIDKVLMPEQRPISEIAAAEPKLSTLMTAVTSANLAQQLERQNGPWTVFAPINSAFAALPTGALDSLLQANNRQALARTLGLHVVPGRVAARELLAKKRLSTLFGQTITMSLENGRLTVGGTAKLVATDIQASNGVIHLIDSVLLPVSEAKPEAAIAQTTDKPTSRNLNDAAVAAYEAAIGRGVPLFNNGNEEACAAVYATAIESMVLLGGADLGAPVIEVLNLGLAQAKQETSARDQAWALRRALDEAYLIIQRSSAGPRGRLQDQR